MKDIQFTIITATVGRQSLLQACQSIDRQDHRDWQHLVLFDGKNDEFDDQLLRDISHPNRQVLFTGVRHNDFGNMAKHLAYPHINGDYVMYIDDDNYQMNNTMKVLNSWLRRYKVKYGDWPDWGVFPMTYTGNWFFNWPPGLYKTDGGQIFHKPVIKGQRIQWTTNKNPCEDGRLINQLKLLVNPVRVDHKEPLANFPKANSIREMKSL